METASYTKKNEYVSPKRMRTFIRWQRITTLLLCTTVSSLLIYSSIQLIQLFRQEPITNASPQAALQEEYNQITHKIAHYQSAHAKAHDQLSIIKTIASIMPPSVRLTRLSFEASLLHLHGQAQSIDELTSLYKLLSRTPHLSSCTLKEISHADKLIAFLIVGTVE